MTSSTPPTRSRPRISKPHDRHRTDRLFPHARRPLRNQRRKRVNQASRNRSLGATRRTASNTVEEQARGRAKIRLGQDFARGAAVSRRAAPNVGLNSGRCREEPPAFTLARNPCRKRDRTRVARKGRRSAPASRRAPACDARRISGRRPPGACRSCFGDSAGRLPGTCGRSQPWQRLVRRRRSARSRRRPYGGAVVKWHGLRAIVWLVLRGDVVAVRGAARAFAGSRRLVMLIWRSGCQGVGVDGHGVVGAAGCCGCGSRGGPGVRGVRDVRSCSYSGAGYPKTFVRRTSAV